MHAAVAVINAPTWKGRTTPLGRRYLERAASVLRTSGSGSTSVPTPNTPSGGPNSRSTATHTGGMDLEGAVSLAAVPTPKVSTGDYQNGRDGKPILNLQGVAKLAGNNDYSRKIVELASTATPTAEDSQCTGGHRGCHDTLSAQAKCSSVASPSARDYKDSPGMSETGVDPDGSIRSRLDQLPRQAQLADSGLTATGGTPATKSTGQLNPDYSRWLMVCSVSPFYS